MLREDGHVKMEADAKVKLLPVKGHVGGSQKLEEARKDYPLESSEGVWSGQHLDCVLPVSRTVKDTFLCMPSSVWYCIMAVLGS